MPESKIIQAIKEYKDEYAWDLGSKAKQVRKNYEAALEFDYLDEFVRSAQASKQSDSGVL